MFHTVVLVQILSRQIQILNHSTSRNTCTKLTKENSKYFLSKLLYYTYNITIFLPEYYSVILDVTSLLKEIIFAEKSEFFEPINSKHSN